MPEDRRNADENLKPGWCPGKRREEDREPSLYQIHDPDPDAPFRTEDANRVGGPGIPLPCSRISMPFATFPAIMLVGNDPNRYPSGIQRR
jgi:hypothetical protein